MLQEKVVTMALLCVSDKIVQQEKKMVGDRIYRNSIARGFFFFL